ncbi:MAG: hypothetical protein LC778_05485, partial [Acidobacteria bacterium]|nr:hypothetical protein [Acidobacteriota bacterium]
DRPFKHFVRESEKRNLAKVQALNDKREGVVKTGKEFRQAMQNYIADPTPLMREQIEHYADVTTFQNSNAFLDFYDRQRKALVSDKALAKLVPSAAERKAIRAVASAAYIGVGQFATFVRTPANVGTRTLEYFFPTGVVKAAWQFSQIGRSSQRAKWFEDTKIKRENYLKHLEKERAAEDKNYQAETAQVEKRLKMRFGKIAEKFHNQIQNIKSADYLPKIKAAEIESVNEARTNWIEKWNKTFAEEMGKRQSGFEQIKRERALVDAARDDYWKGEEAGADMNFSAFENRAFAEAAGRAGFGGTVGGLILLGVVYGLIEAVGTTDYAGEKEKDEAKRVAGIPNDSISFGGYRFKYSNNPFGYALKMGINLFEQFDRKGSTEQRAEAMAKRFGKDVIATNPLAQSAFSDDFKHKDWGGWLGSKLAAPIPRILQEIGEVLDDEPRKYWDEGFLAQFKIKIPGWRESLPASDSYVGTTAERGDIWRRFLRLLDPVKTVKENAPQSDLPNVPIGTKKEQLKLTVDQLREKAKKGEDVGENIRQMLREGEIKEADANKIFESIQRNMSDKAAKIKAAKSPLAAIVIFKTASEEEKAELLPYLMEKGGKVKTAKDAELYRKAINEYREKQKR